MAHRVLLLSSAFIFTLFISCHAPAHEETEPVLLNADSAFLENRNGIMYRDGMPFSGSIYRLNPVNKDTLAIAGYCQGKEQGEWKRFYANGQPEELRYFDKGVKSQTLTRWWDNGQKQFSCTFQNGEYDGALKEWNKNGQLTKEMNYRNGYETGSQKAFYDNGKIRSNYVIRNGKRTGLLGTKNCVNVSDSIFRK